MRSRPHTAFSFGLAGKGHGREAANGYRQVYAGEGGRSILESVDLVIRIGCSLEELGMPPTDIDTLEKAINKRNGKVEEEDDDGDDDDSDDDDDMTNPI